MEARFTHVNIVSENWRKLAQFYTDVFGCEQIGPERDLSGEWLAKGTGVKDAELQGAHLRLPGHGAHGPTLEIFQFSNELPKNSPAANRQGVRHLAFHVEDVQSALQAVLAAGGEALGEVVERDVPEVGWLTFVYAADPEGNILELQRWDNTPTQ